MHEIEVVHPGVLSLIQDDGRKGLAFYGIPASGHLDPGAAHRANLAVGNPACHPVIECHLVAPKLAFRHAIEFAVAGADFGWEIDGDAVERDRVTRARPGSVLSGKAARDGAQAAVPLPERVRLRGPAPAPLERIRSLWRWQILISAPNREALREVLERIESRPVPSSVRRIVDVDPLSTL